MYPKILDTIRHEGCLYAFSVRNNHPAVLKGSTWVYLDDYNFVPVAGKKGTWETVSKSLPNKPNMRNVRQQGYVNFSVDVNIHGQVIHYDVSALDRKQVERKVWGLLARDMNLPINVIRSRLLPDSLNINTA